VRAPVCSHTTSFRHCNQVSSTCHQSQSKLLSLARLACSVLVPTQRIWLSDNLSSTLRMGTPIAGAQNKCIEVLLWDDLCSSTVNCESSPSNGMGGVSLGMPLSIVGAITLQPAQQQAGPAGLVASLHTLAYNATPAFFHAPWLPASCGAVRQQSGGRRGDAVSSWCMFGKPAIALSPFAQKPPAIATAGDSHAAAGMQLGALQEALVAGINGAAASHLKLDNLSRRGSVVPTAVNLQALVTALLDAHGCYLPPLMALAMLVSAALTGTIAASKNLRQHPLTSCQQHLSSKAPSLFAQDEAMLAGKEQPRKSLHTLPLMVLHDPGEPQAARSLWAVARLLCPVHASSGPVGAKSTSPAAAPPPFSSADSCHDVIGPPCIEQLPGMVDAATAELACVHVGSLLHGAASGVCVVDSTHLSSSGSSCGGVRGGSVSSMSNGAARASGLVTNGGGLAGNTAAGSGADTATVWCVADGPFLDQPMASRTRGVGASSSGSRKSAGGRGNTVVAQLANKGLPPESFLCVQHSLSEAVTMMCVTQAGMDTATQLGRAALTSCAARLRCHMALVAAQHTATSSTLSPEAQVCRRLHAWHCCQEA
jgi:hypothetical protein